MGFFLACIYHPWCFEIVKFLKEKPILTYAEFEKLISDEGLYFIVQGLTWLLPERFSDSEIGPEAGFVKLW